MNRPNILLITSDQQRKETMGCYGSVCRTPNLDRLAGEGVVFDRAYCPHATCSPARASILTGQYGSRHGCYSIGVSLPYDCLKLTDSLAQGGYESYLVGKAHFRSCGTTGEFESRPRIFDESFWRDYDGGYFGFTHTRLCIGHTTEPHGASMHYRVWLRDHGVTDKDFAQYFHSDGDGRVPNYEMGPWAIPEELHPSTWVGGVSCDYLDRAAASANPFFLWASFPDPHIPFRVPEPYASMYSPDEVPRYGFREGEYDDKPAFFKIARDKGWDKLGWNDRHGLPSAFFTKNSPVFKDNERRALALYYGMMTLVDKNCGRILSRLHERGLHKNTIVVFTTDHGDYMGNHGLWSKGLFCYEDVYNIPMIVRSPGCGSPGSHSDALQSLVDIAPTVLSMSGLPIPAAMQGRDQSEVWRGRAATARDCVKIENRPVREGVYQKMLVTDEFKLVIYEGQRYGELYDMKRDREHDHNLWDDPSRQEDKTRLLQRLISYEMESEGRPLERTAFS